MSLIADALKKAQTAKLGRRYLSHPDPKGVLPVKEDQGGKGQDLFGLLSIRMNLSPTLWIGLVSGLLLFVILFAYFFYGRAKPATRFRSGSAARPTGLILAPPSVPAVEPLDLAKKTPAGEVIGENAAEEKTPARKGVEERRPAKKRRADGEHGAVPRAEVRSNVGGGAPDVAVTPALSEEVRRQFNLALSYQEEGNLSMARRTYEKVVQMWPLYVEAHNNLGVVYKELRMYDQAVSHLNKAVALNPRYPSAYHNLGVIYQLRGDLRQATKNYETALSLDQNHLSSYNNLGLIYRSQGRLHEAREILEKALVKTPYLSQTHYNLALVLDELGETELARVHYRRFVDGAGAENRDLAEKVQAYLRERPRQGGSFTGSGARFNRAAP